MATLELENLVYKKRNIVYAFVRHRLMLLCKQSVRKFFEKWGTFLRKIVVKIAGYYKNREEGNIL